MRDEFLDPEAGRATVYETSDGLRIVVPSKKRILISVFLCFWLCGWAFGWIAAAGALFSGSAGGGSLFLFFWLGAWTVGGAFALGIVGWMLFGREVVFVTPQGIHVTRSIGAFRRGTNCRADHISDLRSVDEGTPSMFGGRNMPAWFMSGFSYGAIKFDYGSRTLGFGLELERGEAKKIVDLIVARFDYLRA